MFSVVKLGSYDDIAGTVRLKDAARGGEGIEPYDGECHDFDEYASRDDAEREADEYGTDTVFDCLDRVFSLVNVFVPCQSVKGNSREFVAEGNEFAVGEAGRD